MEGWLYCHPGQVNLYATLPGNFEGSQPRTVHSFLPSRCGLLMPLKQQLRRNF